MKNKISIYTDGGARGNPGPAGVGVVIEGLPDGKKKISEYIGTATNNVAEYRALILGLRTLKELYPANDYEINCYADSELMVKQLNGEYKIRDMNLRELFLEVSGLKNDLGMKISFNHVAREKNAEADELVNEILDKETGKTKFEHR
ncbi:MAG: ribonuclease HI family protein [Patescibacteria group bacterium]